MSPRMNRAHTEKSIEDEAHEGRQARMNLEHRSILSRIPLVLATFALATSAACGGGEETGATPPPATPPPPAAAPAATEPPKAAIHYDAIERDEVNRLALHHNLPLYWVADKNGNKAADPDEVV